MNIRTLKLSEETVFEIRDALLVKISECKREEANCREIGGANMEKIAEMWGRWNLEAQHASLELLKELGRTE